ncbi:MAG: hypothetical protein AAGF24_09880 [Cyanobacteria bacterium P01_H01_bin.121]
MTPSLLKIFWSLVEETQTHLLLQLDDDSLAQWLLHQICTHWNLNRRDTALVSRYIQQRLPLIRDLAHARLAS